MFVKFVLISAITLLSQTAFSQIYKCKNAKGKVIYSEEHCTVGTRGEAINLEPNIIDNSGLRKQLATQKSGQPKISSQPITSETTKDIMSFYNKDLRIRELKIDMGNQHASYERRNDAQTELNYLAKNPVYSLTYEDELKRRNLKVDLESQNQSTRHHAMWQLSELYRKY